MKLPYLHHLALAGAVLIGTALGTHAVQASDHDDGTNDYKVLNTNLTDLFVFNADTHDLANAGDTDVVLVMNVNPRALPQQEYFFNTDALYDFNVRRVTEAHGDAIPTGGPIADLVLRCQFDAPVDGQQPMALTAYYQSGTTTIDSTTVTAGDQLDVDGDVVASGVDMETTPFAFDGVDAGVADGVATDGNGVGRRTYDDAAVVNDVVLDAHAVKVFAGLREDPFFFDVERYFKVRSSAARGVYDTVFERAEATDFTTGYNVLSIVLKVPRALLGATGPAAPGTATRFDVWETVQVKM